MNDDRRPEADDYIGAFVICMLLYIAAAAAAVAWKAYHP